jgi:hypothetical protein
MTELQKAQDYVESLSERGIMDIDLDPSGEYGDHVFGSFYRIFPGWVKTWSGGEEPIEVLVNTGTLGPQVFYRD